MFILYKFSPDLCLSGLASRISKCRNGRLQLSTYIYGARDLEILTRLSVLSQSFFYLINFVMTFLNKEKHFNLLYFLSPNVRGARRKPPPRGDPGGSASSAGLGGLLYGSMGPPGVSPTLPPNASRNSILTILISNSIQYGLELCMFIFYKFSPDFCLSGLASQ